MQISEKDIQSEKNRQEIRKQLEAELKDILPEEQIQEVVIVYNKVSVAYDFMERRN